jgi:hypothetical protein
MRVTGLSAELLRPGVREERGGRGGSERRERETAADGSNMSGDWRFEVCFEVCVYSFLRCVCVVL